MLVQDPRATSIDSYNNWNRWDRRVTGFKGHPAAFLTYKFKSRISWLFLPWDGPNSFHFQKTMKIWTPNHRISLWCRSLTPNHSVNWRFCLATTLVVLHYIPFTALSDTHFSKVNLLMLSKAETPSKSFCTLNTPMRFVNHLYFQVLIRAEPAQKAVHPHETQRLSPRLQALTFNQSWTLTKGSTHFISFSFSLVWIPRWLERYELYLKVFPHSLYSEDFAPPWDFWC